MKQGRIGNLVMLLLFLLVVVFLLLLSKNKGDVSLVIKDITSLFS